MRELASEERRQRLCRRSSVQDAWKVGALTCALQLPLGACYQFAAQHAPVIGASVQLTLTDSGAAALPPLVGTSPARLPGHLACGSAGMDLRPVSRTVR